jgi:hypothetical protein
VGLRAPYSGENMERTINVLELAKGTRNTINIEGVDGVVFSISRITQLISELYNKLQSETKEASEKLLKVQTLVKSLEGKSDVKEIERIKKKVESIIEETKGSDERYIKKQGNIIRAILEINGIEYDKSYWKKWDFFEINLFIKECIEKDINPKKKTA